MIISHKHKFIFMKTRKTAGTSIQVALSKICGPDDIITGTYMKSDGTLDESHSGGKNVDKFFTNHPHPPIAETKQFLGDEIWNSYVKFAFVRNPYEIQVSRYFWNKKGKNKNEECSIEGFKEWVKLGNMADFDLLHPYIIVNDSIEMDFIGRYETLHQDFDKIYSILNIHNNSTLPDKPELPVVKGGYRDKKHYSEFYDTEIEDIVFKHHQSDIHHFGYAFNPDFSTSRVGPVVTPDMLPSDIGNNINGPSLIKVPDWLENPLGKYYLYFAHHGGKYIRMAYSDDIEGPWKIHTEGTLQLEESECEDHIASPDVHIDDENKRIVMYYHGVTQDKDAPHYQSTFVAFSDDGIKFKSNSGVLGLFYFRAFRYKNKFYALAKNKNVDGILYESDSWDGEFKPVFNLIPNMRHCAVLLENDTLYIFYTVVGHNPESILVCKVELSENIEDWDIVSNQVLLKPEVSYEGSRLQKMPSVFGSINYPVNQVRDPYVFTDNKKTFLLYSLAGETGIGLAQLYKLKG